MGPPGRPRGKHTARHRELSRVSVLCPRPHRGTLLEGPQSHSFIPTPVVQAPCRASGISAFSKALIGKLYFILNKLAVKL